MTVVQVAPPSDDDSTTYDWIVEPESVGAVHVSDAEVPVMLAATAVGDGKREETTAAEERIGLASRKPTAPSFLDVSRERVSEEDKFFTRLSSLLYQLPPRAPRDDPAAPLKSFHSNTLPAWSKVP